VIIYFIFLENDLFFSLRDGSSFIVPSFSKTIFYYPSYNFFELYPSYSAYFSVSQASFTFASAPLYLTFPGEAWEGQELDLTPFQSSPLLLHQPYRTQFNSFLPSYHRLAPLFLFTETATAVSCSETRSRALFSLFSYFPLLTLEAHFDHLCLHGSLLPRETASSLSSFLLASSALTCYEGSSIQPFYLPSFSDAKLSLALNTQLLFKKFPHFFLNEAFSNDIAFSPRTDFFSEDQGIGALYRFLCANERSFFHNDSVLFLSYASLLSAHGLSSSDASSLFSLKYKSYLASHTLASFLKDQRQTFIFKTGDQVLSRFLFKHSI
jgi:hypothetical protein